MSDTFAEPDYRAPPDSLSPSSSDAVPPSKTLDGSWERAGRNPNAAAILALLGIGWLYFNGQSILVVISMVISKGHATEGASSVDIIEKLTRIAQAGKNPIRFSLVLSQFALMLVPVLWFIRRWHTRDIRRYIRLRKCSFPEVLLAVAATVLLFPLNMAVSNFFIRQLHIPDFLIGINEILFTATTRAEFFLLIFVVAVTPAICEEIFFRGYAQRTFERSMGWKSILLAGFIFGLYHMNPLGLLSLSMMGFLFGYLYFRSGSLLPSMAAHFTNNFLVVAMLYFKPYLWGSNLTTHFQIPGLVLFALVLLEIMILAMYAKISHHNREETGSAPIEFPS